MPVGWIRDTLSLGFGGPWRMQIMIQSEGREGTTLTDFNPSLLDLEAPEQLLREPSTSSKPLVDEDPRSRKPDDEMGPALGVLIAAGIGGGWWTMLFAAFRAVG